ncbi:MAG: MurR/RpiR family transcriptional regulator [Lachnospiraceae bacterium]|nr:MurR/RpiR family transcriptional regulator [Lachnospiraceae bacterium]
MLLLKEMRQVTGLTEREQDICNYILEHPEQVAVLSSRELGHATFTSAASVTRFCQKMGCKGYPDFRLRFVSELKLWDAKAEEKIQIEERENIVSLVKKISELERKAVDETRKALSLEQMLRIGKMVHQAECVDFYVYDLNVHLAQYGCSQLLHAGKMAYTYIATNVQQLHALIPKENHLAIVISHTGENSRLGEIIKTLKKRKTKVIVISANRNRLLPDLGDEFIYAAGAERLDEFWTAMFFSSVKYLLDIMFGMEFSANYEQNMKLNEDYEKIGAEKLWALSNNEQ